MRGQGTKATVHPFLKRKLPALMQLGKSVIQILNDVGFEGYVVGGSVRDFIMKHPIHDVDVTTNATPQQVIKLFRERGYKAIPTGEEFGTITILFNDKPIEITTYRSEGKYEDYRHPGHVKWETDITKDLSRRDFTINAIAYDPVSDTYIDPFGGRNDIKNNVLRAVGNPNERFKEDPLRMMRYARFYGRFGSKADKKTVSAMKTEKRLLSKIPKERVRDELFKILQTDGASESVRLLASTGLLDEILPGMSRLEGMPQNPAFHKYDVFTHSIKTMENLPKEKPVLRLAGLIHDIEKPSIDHSTRGKAIAEKIADDLKFSKAEREYMAGIVAHHMDFISYQKKITSRDVRRYINRTDNKEIIDDLVTFSIADSEASGMQRKRVLGREFAEALKEVEIKKEPTGVASLKVRGEDIMALGFNGPEVGRVLKTLANEVVDDPMKNTREWLINRAKQL